MTTATPFSEPFGNIKWRIIFAFFRVSIKLVGYHIHCNSAPRDFFVFRIPIETFERVKMFFIWFKLKRTRTCTSSDIHFLSMMDFSWVFECFKMKFNWNCCVHEQMRAQPKLETKSFLCLRIYSGQLKLNCKLLKKFVHLIFRLAPRIQSISLHKTFASIHSWRPENRKKTFHKIHNKNCYQNQLLFSPIKFWLRFHIFSKWNCVFRKYFWILIQLRLSNIFPNLRTSHCCFYAQPISF